MSKNIALIGASGNIGTKIAAELISRGHTVTGIARNPEKIQSLDGMKTATGDYTKPETIAGIMAGHDAIISAASFIPGEAEKLIGAVRASGVKRFLMVGGAASLQTEDGGPKVIDTIELPDFVKPIIMEGIRTLELLRMVDDIEWTFLSPAVQIGAGERTGKFRLGTEVVVRDENGNSNISYDDFAIAMVDELEQNRHIKSRFTLGY